MTQEVIAAIFEEWKRRYDADPEGFQSIPDFLSDPPKSYGEGAARYFLLLLGEMYVYELELDKYVQRT